MLTARCSSPRLRRSRAPGAHGRQRRAAQTCPFPAVCASAAAPGARKSLAHTPRAAAARSLRVNIGNVHFEQGRMPPAIKAYRMALDALPPSAGRQRGALLRNIGLAFVRMGQYADAASAYEAALAAAPEHLVCVGEGVSVCGVAGLLPLTPAKD